MTSPSAPQLRVLSYNVHHCNPPAKPGVIDVEAIAAVINRLQPDLVALQEVDVKNERSCGLDEAEILAEQTGMQLFFAPALEFRGGHYGIAILSKYLFLEHRNIPLPNDPESQREARVLAMARVQTFEGFVLTLANTHLDSTRDDSVRRLQIEAVLEELRPLDGAVILAGDFNDTPGSATIEALGSELKRTDRPGEWTHPADEPRHTIDFIAYRAGQGLRLISTEVVPETSTSDHRPVSCVFEVDTG